MSAPATPLTGLPLRHLYRAPTASTAQPWLLVLMHGVGSNEDDLFSLAPHVPPGWHVLSLGAPYAMRGMPRGAWAWFEFGIRPDGSRVIDVAQEAASRALVGHTVADAARQLGVDAARVVVGGFSQGGIMSMSLLLTQPTLLHAALVMHSRLLPEVLPQAAPAEALRGKAVWVSHGTQDMVIPLASAHATRDHFSRLPVSLTYAEFPGAHEIRPAELSAAMNWLRGLSGHDGPH